MLSTQICMEQKYDVFISYSRKDYIDEKKNIIPGNVISLIKDTLAKNGISYWFDEEGINYGQNFVEKIVTNIEASRVFLFLSSANSNNSEWTCKEIASADEFKKLIIPMRIDSTPYNKKVLLRIADLNYIEYYSNPSKGLTDMVDAIKVELESIRIQEKKIREKEESERKEQELYIKKIKLQCESINTREAQIEIDRSNLLLQSDIISDIDARESLKTYISNSSPIRQKCQSSSEEIEQLKTTISNLQDTNKKLNKDLQKKSNKVIVHLVYILTILLLALIILLRKSDTPPTSSDEVPIVSVISNSKTNTYAYGNTALDDSLNVIFGKLKTISPQLKSCLDGYNDADPKATHQLGKYFDKGDFLEGNRNLKIAGMLFHRAADADYAEAQTSLGFYFYNGRGGYQQNYDSSSYWYKRAIANGSNDAEYYLATAYSTGTYTGTTQSKYRTKEAVDLYLKSARAGNAKSQIALGIYYYNNTNDYKQALYWIEKGLQGDLSDMQTLKSSGQSYLRKIKKKI